MIRNNLKKIPFTGRKSGVLTISNGEYIYDVELYKGTVLVLEDNSENTYKATGFSKHIYDFDNLDEVAKNIQTMHLVLTTREEESQNNLYFYDNDEYMLNYNIIIHFNQEVFNNIKKSHLDMLRDIALHGREHGITLVLIVRLDDDSVSMEAVGNQLAMNIMTDDKNIQYVWREVFSTSNEIVMIRKDNEIATNLTADFYNKEEKISIPQKINAEDKNTRRNNV